MVLPTRAVKQEHEQTDVALVIAARAGDPAAQKALFRRYASMVSGLAFRLLGREDAVDDLVQESFAQVFRSLTSLKVPETFPAWLSSIVVRMASKWLRGMRLWRRFGLVDCEPIDLDTLVSNDAPPDVTAELRMLYGIVDELPSDLRVVLLLARVDGYKLEEIATLTGKSLATVKRRLRQAARHVERRTGSR